MVGGMQGGGAPSEAAGHGQGMTTRSMPGSRTGAKTHGDGKKAIHDGILDVSDILQDEGPLPFSAASSQVGSSFSGHIKGRGNQADPAAFLKRAT